MSDTIITLDGIGKKYQLGQQNSLSRYTALRDVLFQRTKLVGRRMWSAGKRPLSTSNGQERDESFWALRDVSFDVKVGEVLGIIGCNGAGKSTLLKILTRITEPTVGKATIKGRVASLLEVGTGFHPELTGRENIFLNGAILGMTRAEIRTKFDEIVAFAEVEKFIDTPVKRYSSGMYVRLAFAVAAHLEPEILIVDEVLAVGDAEFQSKCLGKMQEVSTGGRTVLFVSHNMAAVRHLCTRGVYLVNGNVHSDGEIEWVIGQYLAGAGDSHSLFQARRKNDFELQDFRLCESGSSAARTSVVFGEDYQLQFRISIPEGSVRVNPVVRVYNSFGMLVSSICAPEEGVNGAPHGTSHWTINISSLQLMPGRYSLTFQLFGSEPDPYLEVHDALRIVIEPIVLMGATKAYRPDHGVVRIARGISVRTEATRSVAINASS